MLRENWHLEGWALGGAPSAALNSVGPCQSTGLWYLQPTNLTVRFMRQMVQRISWDAVWQWDQVRLGGWVWWCTPRQFIWEQAGNWLSCRPLAANALRPCPLSALLRCRPACAGPN